MAINKTITVSPETEVTLFADEFTEGSYILLEDSGGRGSVDILPAETVVLGPYAETRRYLLVSDTGRIQVTYRRVPVDAVDSQSVEDALSEADLTTVLPALTDLVLIKDSSDNGILKTVTVQSIVDLASGGGSVNPESVTHAITQVGHGFSLGEVIALNSSGLYIKAIANSATTSEVIGIVSSVDGSDDFTLTSGGKIFGLSGLLAGSVYFLSDSIAGQMTLTKPFLPDSVEKTILVADSSTTGYVTNYLGVTND